MGADNSNSNSREEPSWKLGKITEVKGKEFQKEGRVGAPTGTEKPGRMELSKSHLWALMVIGPQGHIATSLLSVFMDLPVQDIFYKWNHITYDLLCLAVYILFLSFFLSFF